VALPLYRTLGELRADIQVRLGFGTAGQSGVVNAPLVDSMLRSAQNQLYEQFEWSNLQSVQLRTTGQNQQFYDYPSDCNVDKIQGIYLTYGGQNFQLKEGIEATQRGFPISSVPCRFERRDQIEIWPVPQAIYPLRFEYTKTLGPFTANSDRCSLPDEIVLLHALSNAKAHYRQPDSKEYASQLDAMMQRIKARHRGNKVYSSRGSKRSIYDYAPDPSQME
jgi:hypothetical protein